MKKLYRFNPKPTKEYYNATETTMEEKHLKPAAAKATKNEA